MRILLIDPPTNCFTGLMKRGYPIGLCMLAAVAKNEGIQDVSVYDVDKSLPPTYGLNFSNQKQNMARFLDGVNNLDHPVWKSISQTLDSFKPDIVGITTMTIQYAAAMRVAQTVKSWDKKCPVIVGGAHTSVMPISTIEWPYIDMIVKGEGEEAFRQIIQRLKDGQTDMSDIHGVITKSNASMTNIPPIEISDLDILPIPAREMLMHKERYTPEDLALILTSRGCPYHCSYCSNFSRKTRFRSIENVINEIEIVKNKYNASQFMFKDDSFSLRRNRVEEFCRKLHEKKLDINWECTTRLDLLDDSLVKMMMSAGCNRIGVGVESGDEQMLQIYSKRLTKDQIRKGAKILNANKMFWTAYFMMGLPMESEQQIYSTIGFMKEIKPSYAAIGIYKPYPGTKLFDMAADLGLVDANVPNEHFLNTNPVDYFFKDAGKRCAYISLDKLTELTCFMEQEFEKYNKKFSKIFKRAISRYKLYLSDYKSFTTDIKRIIRWYIPKT